MEYGRHVCLDGEKVRENACGQEVLIVRKKKEV